MRDTPAAPSSASSGGSRAAAPRGDGAPAARSPAWARLRRVRAARQVRPLAGADLGRRSSRIVPLPSLASTPATSKRGGGRRCLPRRPPLRELGARSGGRTAASFADSWDGSPARGGASSSIVLSREKRLNDTD